MPQPLLIEQLASNLYALVKSSSQTTDDQCETVSDTSNQQPVAVSHRRNRTCAATGVDSLSTVASKARNTSLKYSAACALLGQAALFIP